MGEQGLELYPHQDEAIIELLGGSNVVLATPTGSGKSLVALGAHAAALATDRVSFYTAPIKALVSEKFFNLCEVFGAEHVGMLTGDASVNADAPIICCTAEVLANIALREGPGADVGLVVMDEFHFYAEPDRGWAWQVPLLELTSAQFLLMSATLGDVTDLAADLTRRNGRETAVVDDAVRPVPLSFTWAMTPLAETLEELVITKQAPAYVVHFTQKDAVEHATALLSASWATADRAQRDEINERLAGFRFGAGFGKTLSKLLRRGIGVHHAGMLPRYRRAVEQLAQDGLLPVICGTDTLGRRHQRADPHGALHRPHQVRRHQAADPAHPRVPPDRRSRRTRRLRHGRVRRRAGARAHHRQRAGEGEVGGQERRAERGEAGQAEEQGTAEEAARGHRGVDRADLRQAGRGGARGAGVADEGRQLDADQRAGPRGERLRRAPSAADRQPRAAPPAAAAAPDGPSAWPAHCSPPGC